jgi:hypothetical protein
MKAEIQYNPMLEVELKEAEIKVASESFYDRIYDTASDLAKRTRSSSEKLASVVVDKGIQKTAEEVLKQAVGYAGKIFNEHPQETVAIAMATGQQLFKQMAESAKTKEDLKDIENQFMEKLKDTKRMEAAKKANECIFFPTPGCQDEVKKMMDELNGEPK